MRPKPPKHLTKDIAKWWSSAIDHYVLEPHHTHLLTLACEALDRCQQARTQLENDGLVVATGDGGLKTHPAVAIERDSRAAFAALLKQLGLDDVDEPKRGPGRPPRGIGWKGDG